MNKKNIKENSSAGGSASGYGAPLSRESARSGGHPFVREVSRRKSKNVTTPFTPVEEIAGKMKVSKQGVVVSKGKKKKLTPVKFENKSESTLREAIRNLVFLNRVKYHEEQVKREMQEQKVRKIIRYLLNEKTERSSMSTTGENNAFDYVNNIESTTLDNLYKGLASTELQRKAFRYVYLMKLKLYLDSLDQQYILLHPEDRPQNFESIEPKVEYDEADMPKSSPSEPIPTPATPVMPGVESPAAKRHDLNEVNEVPGGLDTSRLQTHVMTTRLNIANLDTTGMEQAHSALIKDLPQVDKSYSMLTFKPINKNNKQTSDRQLFREMLLGNKDSDGKGNLYYKFLAIDLGQPTADVPAANLPTPAPTPPVPAQTSTPTSITGEVPKETPEGI